MRKGNTICYENGEPIKVGDRIRVEQDGKTIGYFLGTPQGLIYRNTQLDIGMAMDCKIYQIFDAKIDEIDKSEEPQTNS